MKDSDIISYTHLFIIFIKQFVATVGRKVDAFVSLIFVTFHGLILINIYVIWCPNALVPYKCQILKCWHFLGKSKNLNELIKKELATQRFQCKMQFISADKKVHLRGSSLFFNSVLKLHSMWSLIPHFFPLLLENWPYFLLLFKSLLIIT